MSRMLKGSATLILEFRRALEPRFKSSEGLRNPELGV